MTQAETYARTFWKNRRRNDKLTQLNPIIPRPHVKVEGHNRTIEEFAAEYRLVIKGSTIPGENGRLETGQWGILCCRLTFGKHATVTRANAYRMAVDAGMLVDVVSDELFLAYFNSAVPEQREPAIQLVKPTKKYKRPDGRTTRHWQKAKSSFSGVPAY